MSAYKTEMTEQEKINKKKIMEELGVLPEDINEYFDITEERVYKPKEDSEVHEYLNNEHDKK